MRKIVLFDMSVYGFDAMTHQHVTVVKLRNDQIKLRCIHIDANAPFENTNAHKIQ